MGFAGDDAVVLREKRFVVCHLLLKRHLRPATFPISANHHALIGNPYHSHG